MARTTTSNINQRSKIGSQPGWIICAIVFIIYMGTIKHGYVLDDFSVIKDNTVTTRGIAGIPDIFSHFYRYGGYPTSDGIYRPLPVAMFALEWQLSPNYPTLNHFVNVLLYALTGWLMYITLARLLKNYNLVFPFTVTLLFMTHPLHTEVVANIKSRDEVLCFFLSFATLYYILDYLENRQVKKLCWALLLFFAAFLSKETAITMVVVIPLALYFFAGIKGRALFHIASGLCGVTLVFLLLRAWVLHGVPTEDIPAVINPLLMAGNYADRLATAIQILGEYLWLLIYPGKLLYDRSFNHIPIVNFSNPYVLLSLLAYAAIIVYALWGFVRKNLLSFGIAFYLITISLFSNILYTVGVAMADRFVYFASFGFCFALAVLLMKVTKTQAASVNYLVPADIFRKNKTFLFLALLLAFLYSVKTIKRNKDWKDNYTLFYHDANLSPDNALTHYRLGTEIVNTLALNEQDVLKRNALLLEAIVEFRKSLEIYPRHASALRSVGTTYMMMDSLEQAERFFRQELVLNQKDPSKLADLYFAKKDYQKAIELYKDAITLNPGYTDGFVNLGICYGTLRQYANSIAYLQKALAVTPPNPQIYYMLSTAYKFNGDTANSEKYYQLAYNLNPGITRP